MNNTVKVIIGVVGIIGLMLVMGSCSTYNSLVDKEGEVEKSWAQVQTQYQRRADLIPNVVEAVKGASEFEQSTFTSIAEARSTLAKINVPESAFDDPAKMQKYMAAQQKLGQGVGRLLATFERYPDLKATTAYRDLITELEGTENRISVARQRFNDSVKEYNVAIKKFPTVIFAAILGFDKASYFEAAEGSEEAPKVDFSK